MRLHRPYAYRYKAADRGFWTGPNRYGWRVIGWGIRLGQTVYCVKWASL